MSLVEDVVRIIGRVFSILSGIQQTFQNASLLFVVAQTTIRILDYPRKPEIIYLDSQAKLIGQ